MATSELEELRRRARWLAEHPLGDSPARDEFRRALNRLRALTGQPPLVDEALEFEREVRDSLLRLQDVVLTLPPLEPARGRPDFVVTRGAHAVVVKAMAERGFSNGFARRRARELAEALPRFDASRASSSSQTSSTAPPSTASSSRTSSSPPRRGFRSSSIES
jgi:hypothetical protein